MSKKKNEEERKPDLNEADEQAAIEARIKEMMEPEPSKPATKAIPVTLHEDEEPESLPASAPELPGTKKATSIKVVDHAQLEDLPIEAASDDESDSEVLAAIEEANQQLKGEDEVSDLEETEAPAEEIEPAGEEPGEADTDDELSEAVDEEITEEPETIEPEVDEPEEEPEKAEKPLKHLDSIVPHKVQEVLEDDKTAEAVDDIVAKESDALLEAEDEKLAAAFEPQPKVSLAHKLKTFFGKKAVRVTILSLLLIGIAIAGVVPAARYFVLNTAGVRSAASVVVLDESTQQPLRNVMIRLAGQTASTDKDGKVAFSKLRLGPTELAIEKRAFAPVSKQLTIGWGSNPLGDFKLTPTGSQYVFTVTDFLSGKPLAKVEAVSEDAAAVSNDKGEIRLTIDQQDDHPREVAIKTTDYREERFQLNLDQKEALPISLVAARKHVFISNRDGRLDVYKVDIDGKNEELVLPGTGSERDDMVLVPHPSEEVVALVSTKDNKRNKDGFLLSTLTVINLADNTTKSVATSERVQVIDWVGSRVVYVQVKEGSSASSSDRHKLLSYKHDSQEFKELANSNYFNDVMAAAGKVYYAPSSTHSNSGGASLFRVEADGSNRQTILDKETWNIFRSTYDRLTMAVQQDWYELKLGDTKAGKISGAPPAQTSRVYVDSPDGRRSLWVDIRDGKGVLLAYDTATEQDTVVRTQAGLKNPIRWLTNNTIVYRINTESETADYALNLDGGEPKKIRDVTNTSGIDKWYFY